MGGKLCLKIAAGCLSLAVIGGAAGIVSYADDDLSEYEERQKELDKEAQQYQSVLDQTASDISEKEQYREALLNKITVINEQIANGREQISSLEQQITDMQAEVDSARTGISDRIDVLKQRLRVIYLSGETTSLEIVLGAKDFEDFLDKLELVSYMSNSDQKMINQLQGEIKGINKRKDALSDAKSSLDDEQKKLDERQQELQKLINENEELLGDLYENNAAAQDHLDENSAERKEIEDAIMADYAEKDRPAAASKLEIEARVE
nr:hypothetical protein [Lachnospiraceae bacterium]